VAELTTELPTPEEYGRVAEALVKPDDVAEKMALGPDAERHLELIREYDKAGVTHVYVHQVGRDQEGFFRFYEREILPKL
jgi:coenzyme F420-dependent glucose-6-phosphate dehydrogenase